MADPFKVLHAPITPVDPDPAFTAGLRSRIEQALSLPEGATVSNLTLEPDVATTSRPTTSRPSTTLVPYLAVSGAERALAWYAEALGARRRSEPYVMPDGTIGHAELEIAGGVLMLSEQHPEIGVLAPSPGKGVPVTIHMSVADVDSVIRRAVGAGATLERSPADYEYGRNGVFRDPFGHRWLVSAEPVAPVQTLSHGDIGYVSLFVPDVQRAAAFFSAVLDWHFGPARAPQGRQVQGRGLSHGMWGEQEQSNLFLCFAVENLDFAVERVREAGGTAEEPHEEPYGSISGCTDDQGARFAIFRPPGGLGVASQPRRRTGTHHGDLAYVTMEVVDSERARAFYGSVLGWRFVPGRARDGWQAEDVVPMVGMSGGHGVATTVPMYRVDDIASAVERVRTAGGDATDPEAQPYGVTSSCSDDQGTRFHLGQL